MNQFTWIEIYKEIAAKLREYRNRDHELIGILTDMQKRGLPTISLVDRNAQGAQITLSEIDPFSFFATFNRGIRKESRIEILKMLKDLWGLTSSVPSDFSGIPVMNNQTARFMAFQRDRGKEDVPLLWELFLQALDNNINEQTFNAVSKIKYIGYKITIGLFWIGPEQYLNLDSVNRAYLAKNGITITGPPDYQAYIAYIEKTRSLLQKPFVQISYDAWLQGNMADTEDVFAKINNVLETLAC